MSAPTTLGSRLRAVLVPTRSQALGALFLALLILAAVQADQIMRLVGIGEVATNAARAELGARFSMLLSSPIASKTALITFWASVGLITYLICWSAYNALIEARNEVTLNTAYTNRGHWRGHLETLCLKSVGAVAFLLFFTLIGPGVSFWIALVVPALLMPSFMTTIIAIVAVLGLATQLYLVLALALVTFTPWYRAETFTDQ